MFGIGVQELGLILVVALLVFGPKRLPELARTLGRGLGEFRRASNDLRDSFALDDLQKDLRKELSSDQTIHKPMKPPERPAQAGDDLEQVATAKKHPGELPLGNDHEHHSESDAQSDAESGAESGAQSDPDIGKPSGEAADGSLEIDPADPRRE